MNLWTLPPGAPFLDTLADWWLAEADGDPLRTADALFLLPTRRAARALTEAFLARSEGRPTLLPRIAAVGAPDEAPLALAGALDIPPAVDPVGRTAHLARLVLAWNGADGAPTTADSAWRLAEELAALIDEAHRAEVDLANTLPRAVADDFAEHWGRVLRFLKIVTVHWPKILADMGRIDPAARQVRLLDAQADAWTAHPPGGQVVAAGITGGIPAVARLLRVVANARWGRVLLPGLDLLMPDDAWDAVADNHPQSGFKTLLTRLGATRGDVQPWPSDDLVDPTRADLLHLALRPGAALSAWRDARPALPAGLERLDPADEQEEAVAVALALRDAIETPGARAVLVTPDRALAGRVAAQLARFGVVADDSAGEPLADTPPAVFLRLLARAVADGLGPVALLSVLKHPMAALGLPRPECRRQARQLERRFLRGPAPAPGLPGLRERAIRSPFGDHPLLARLEGRLIPLMQIAEMPEAAPRDALAALLIAAEALAETDTEPGAAALWRLEEGEALAARLAALLDASGILPPQPVATLPGLLDAALAGVPVRTRRALRGRDGGEEHPRIAILGLLEARLLAADLVVLGGLTEGTWPPSTDPGPWMSRPMRNDVGLPSPEERVGQSAHDFVSTCCAAPRAVLSAPRRRDGAPAVPARWLVRIEALLAGAPQGLPLRLPHHPGVAWSRLLDQPGAVCPVRPPAPRPPLARRPRRLSVTEVGTWQRDPYAIYARHVLDLRALDELEQATDHADYGNVVHAALAAFARAAGTAFPPDAAARLRAAMDESLDAQPIRPALRAWWRPRLHRIADWVADAERDRRQRPPRAVHTEQQAEWRLSAGVQPFLLNGRADRIDILADGTVSILDYKTGAVPSTKHLQSGLEPQLTLEAAMVAAGAFPLAPGAAYQLAYWHLTGGARPGAEHALFKRDPAATAAEIDAARAGLLHLVARYDDPATPYLSCPDPGAAPRYSDYTQLARVAEWAESGETP